MPNIFSAVEHQKAYEVWCACGSIKEAATTIGCNYATALKWAGDEYDCPHGCPYHNWEELFRLQNSSKKGLVTISDTNNLAKNMSKLVPMNEQKNEISRKDCVRALIRSDLERILDLEYMYCKTYYDATGMVLPNKCLVDEHGNPRSQEELESYYKLGRKSRDIESAIRALKMINIQIRELARDVLARPSGSDDNFIVSGPTPGEEIDVDTNLSLEAARKLRDEMDDGRVDDLKRQLEQVEREIESQEKQSENEQTEGKTGTTEKNPEDNPESLSPDE